MEDPLTVLDWALYEGGGALTKKLKIKYNKTKCKYLL